MLNLTIVPSSPSSLKNVLVFFHIILRESTIKLSIYALNKCYWTPTML